MNKINTFFTSISNEQLLLAVREMKEFSSVGTLSDGVVRDLSRQIHESFNVTPNDARSIVQKKVLEEAAFRWAGTFVHSASSNDELLNSARNALESVLKVGRGSSGRLILELGDERQVRDAIDKISLKRS